MSHNSPLLVTGGCGFIGSNFILDWVDEIGSEVINIDSLTYAGNKHNLHSLKETANYRLVEEDIRQKEVCHNIFTQCKPGSVIHFAAESHVDRSIESAEVFLQTNIMGTYNLLQAALEYWKTTSKEEKDSFRFIHVSTDEIYGSLQPDEPAFIEKNRVQPNSPYAASKAASDHLVRAWHHTYGLPVITTNCSNNYGPYQFPEKLVPLIVTNAISGKKLPLYGDGKQIRNWLYVKDHCSAIRYVLEKGRLGEVYNIGSRGEKSNLEVVHTICSIIDQLKPANLKGLKHPETGEAIQKYSDLITFIKDRPGHDQRYAMNINKIEQELGWVPNESFEDGMQKTIEWYLKNNDWLENVQSGAYHDWTQKQYGS